MSQETLTRRWTKQLLMASLLALAMVACDGKVSSLPTAFIPEVSGQTNSSHEALNTHVFNVTNQVELESAVQIINESVDDSINYEINLTHGEYNLGRQITEVESKHLDDDQKHQVSAGLVINTNSNLTIRAAEPNNKPVFRVDGINNDVGILINGLGSVTIADIEIHTIEGAANPTNNPIDTSNSVRAALYIGGDQISSKRVKIEGVSCFDNVDRSAFQDELNVEYSGIIIKHAQRADIENVRLERFYGDGVSLFDVFSAYLSNLHIIRDGSRLRSGVVVGMIATGTSFLEINNLYAEGFYKGINIWPSNGFEVEQNTVVLKNAEFVNNSAEMFYLVNAAGGGVELINVKNRGIYGVAFPILQANNAEIENSEFTLLPRDPFWVYPEIWPPYVVRANTSRVINSSIINYLHLSPEVQETLKNQGFSLK